MSILQATTLGLIEGLTEFLPISSTAHLIIASHILDIKQTEFVKFFEIIIQSGAILAVTTAYWKFILNNIKYLLYLLASFIPTAIVGAWFYTIIKRYFFTNNYLIVLALLGFGIIFILLEFCIRKKLIALTKDLSDIKIIHAILIGFFQALSVVPGVSRAGAVMIAMMTLGYKRKDSAVYSFLLAVPTIVSAGLFDLLKQNPSTLHFTNIHALLIGFTLSYISALIVIKWFLQFLQKNTLIVFGVYRIIIALFIIVFYL